MIVPVINAYVCAALGNLPEPVALLNDALILLTAAQAGFPVLTANRAEFDLIHQVAGTGSVVHH